jgi:hypothetical protein
MMAETLSMQEIQARYDGEWVLIGDPEVDVSLNVRRGQVLWHSKDRDEVYRQARQLKPKHCAFLYVGRMPQDMAIVL